MKFDPSQAIKVSADSIEKLRQTDVFRALEWAPKKHRQSVADYIKTNRFELAHEVAACMAEISESE